MSTEINILLRAYDEASGVISKASSNIADSLEDVEASQNSLNNAMKQSLPTLDNVADGTLDNSSATGKLNSAEKNLRDSQTKLTTSVKEYDRSSDSATVTLKDYSKAQTTVS